MSLDYHNSNTVHRRQLAAFLRAEPMDVTVLQDCYRESSDPRTRDLCRQLIVAAKAPRLRDVAGREGNLDSILVKRNALWLKNKIRIVS